MKPINLNNFSNGIDQRGLTASPNSLARAYGFILESDGTLRSQWTAKNTTGWRTGPPGTGKYSFSSGTTDYIIRTTSSGYNNYQTMAEVGGNPIGHEGKIVRDDNGADIDLYGYWFCGVIPREGRSFTVTNQVDGGTTSQDELILWQDHGALFNTENPSYPAYVVYEESPGVLKAEVYETEQERFPRTLNHPAVPNQTIPRSGVIPPARKGVLWGDRMILADTIWYGVDGVATADIQSGIMSWQQTYLTYTNYARYPNAFWVSEPGNPYQYSPLSLDIPVPSNTAIVDMAVCDAGLIVLTSSTAADSGVFLLRGTANDYVVENLRGIGVNMQDHLDSAGLKRSTWWASQGILVWYGADDAIYGTDGGQVVRLDGETTVTMPNYGHKLPQENTGYGSISLASWGDFLFIGAEGRLFAMRSFGSEGAWTQLNAFSFDHDSLGSLRGAVNVGFPLEGTSSIGATDVYMVVAGDFLDVDTWFGPMTFNMSGAWGHGDFELLPEFDGIDYVMPHYIATSSIDLTTEGSGTSGSQVFRVAVETSSGMTDAYADDYVQTYFSPTEAAQVSHSVNTVGLGSGTAYSPDHLSWQTVSHDVVRGDSNDVVMVKGGLGFVTEAFVYASFSGDVRVNSVTLWVSPSKRTSTRWR